MFVSCCIDILCGNWCRGFPVLMNNLVIWDCAWNKVFYYFNFKAWLYYHWRLFCILWCAIRHCGLGAADVAVRQQLSSLLFVKRICEAKIRTLKYGDGELPSLPLVRMPTYEFDALCFNTGFNEWHMGVAPCDFSFLYSSWFWFKASCKDSLVIEKPLPLPKLRPSWNQSSSAFLLCSLYFNSL